MILKVSKYIGFCSGVLRAMETIYENVNKKDFYLFGEIAHNETLISKIKQNGIRIISKISDISPNVKKANILIRTHGVAKKVFSEIKIRGFCAIDRTCPKVKAIHKIIEKEIINKKIIIIGKADHDEIKGIIGQINKDFKKSVFLVENLNDLKRKINFINKSDEWVAISQTTFNFEEFDKIIKYLNLNIKNIKIYNTICKDSTNRRKELFKESLISDFVIIIGSKNSSNSMELYRISKNITNTLHIKNFKEINFENIKQFKKIFITSSASTMVESVLEVLNYLKKYCILYGISYELI